MTRLKDRFKSWAAPVKVPIRSGPLKGVGWSVSSGIRFIRGTFEDYKTAAVVEHIHEGDIVIDVGAHVGYYSAIASRLVGTQGRVISFEPRPVNIRILTNNLPESAFPNVTLIRKGVGASSERKRFETRTGTGTGHVSDTGDIEIDIVALDELAASGELPLPAFLKIDVEGGEIGVLQGARDLIRRALPVILVATHGEKEHTFVIGVLEEHGYRYEILDPGEKSGDVEILALPPARA